MREIRTRLFCLVAVVITAGCIGDKQLSPKEIASQAKSTKLLSEDSNQVIERLSKSMDPMDLNKLGEVVNEIDMEGRSELSDDLRMIILVDATMRIADKLVSACKLKSEVLESKEVRARIRPMFKRHPFLLSLAADRVSNIAENEDQNFKKGSGKLSALQVANLYFLAATCRLLRLDMEFDDLLKLKPEHIPELEMSPEENDPSVIRV
ncbi:MAG: hypothetical protein HY506_02345 [Candidatus Yanofskybacteria bacterium]|nr:hypothetical protein [Candidatus Yanofskybacteria bacterium]